MPITPLEDFTLQLKASVDSISEQLDEFLAELLQKLGAACPVIVDGYQFTFDFGNRTQSKVEKARILVTVGTTKPGPNVKQLIEKNDLFPLTKRIKLGPVTYVFCEVPVYGKSELYREIKVNPANDQFDKSLTRSFIDGIVDEMLQIYVQFNRE